MGDFGVGDVFLVTGASAGIGRAIAAVLVRRKARVVAVGRDRARLEAVREEMDSPGSLHIELKDVAADMEALPEWVSYLKKRYGRLKGFIHSAGTIEVAPLRKITFRAHESMFAVNYLAPVFIAKGFLDRRNNVGAGASVLFVASRAGVHPGKGQALYAGSKAALVATARSIALEVAGQGIRVNCISPGLIRTDMTKDLVTDPLGAQSSTYPLGIGEPGDVAGLAAFLLGDEARWITGQNYSLDGGKEY